jgi:hypothetical protein
MNSNPIKNIRLLLSLRPVQISRPRRQYWYVVLYPTDKAIILKGPWPFAHEYFMETKEHLVIMLLMLVT